MGENFNEFIGGVFNKIWRSFDENDKSIINEDNFERRFSPFGLEILSIKLMDLLTINKISEEEFKQFKFKDIYFI